MKTRQGFVSNSSSSSFIIITNKEAHDAALKEMHPYYSYIVKGERPSFEKVLGKDSVVLFGVTSSDDGPDLYSYEGEIIGDGGEPMGSKEKNKHFDYGIYTDYPMDTEEVLYEYVEKLKEKTDEVFSKFDCC